MTDLGVIKMNKGENTIEVVVPTAATNINAAYEDDICVVDEAAE
jgi:chitin synthase